ncbi:MAG: Lrp/AsnC family transcriptional regulator [Planctomycetota bacterium]|jgi:DNA-binding Lrp family transcriptional regulator
MDRLDCQIIEALQNDFPLSERPYEIIARRLKIPFEQLWDRVEKLMSEGVVRRIGASLDSRKLGFRSTLAAISVKPALVEQATEIIGGFCEVTHSYLRNDEFNIWFTIIAADDERIEHVLEQIRSKLSLASSQVLSLPMKRLFKLNARFKVPL